MTLAGLTPNNFRSRTPPELPLRIAQRVCARFRARWVSETVKSPFRVCQSQCLLLCVCVSGKLFTWKSQIESFPFCVSDSVVDLELDSSSSASVNVFLTIFLHPQSRAFLFCRKKFSSWLALPWNVDCRQIDRKCAHIRTESNANRLVSLWAFPSEFERKKLLRHSLVLSHAWNSRSALFRERFKCFEKFSPHRSQSSGLCIMNRASRHPCTSFRTKEEIHTKATEIAIMSCHLSGESSSLHELNYARHETLRQVWARIRSLARIWISCQWVARFIVVRVILAFLKPSSVVELLTELFPSEDAHSS